MAEQGWIQVFVPMRLVEIGDVPPIPVVVFVRISVPRDAQLPTWRKRSQQAKLYEVAHVSGITILH
jgi:hypothetical protein